MDLTILFYLVMAGLESNFFTFGLGSDKSGIIKFNDLKGEIRMSNRIVNQGAPALTAAVGANLPAACVTTNFHGHLLLDQSIVWIPDPLSPVDQAVMDLVALVDRSAQQPAKLVMWSVPGTADDAEPAQVATWYGQQGPNLVQAHQYAIKMIDELELPYTIVRTPR